MPKILIVEDNEHMHRIYADKFRREGYEVLDAFDGETGVALAVSEQPIVVLLDIMIPKMDGFAVLQKLKEEPSTASIPVIVISNKSQPADVERGLMLGARSYFFKGMTLLDDLANEIRKLCKLRKLILASARQPITQAISKQLSGLGFLCSVYPSTIELTSRVDREHPDAIFIDTKTPGLNLALILHQLSISEKSKMIPVVLVDDAPSAKAALSNSQVWAQLEVPIHPAKLEETVKRCTEGGLQTAPQ